MPSSPEIRLPQDHFVRALLRLVEEVLGEELRSRCVLWGGFGYDPVSMFSMLMYALMQGERSTRRMEELCLYDTRFWFLSGGSRPDHSTFARFRRKLDEDGGLDKLMALVVERACTDKLVRGKTLVVDGTKMPTSGSQWRKYLDQSEATDAAEQPQLEAPAQEALAQEQPAGEQPKRSHTKKSKKPKKPKRPTKALWDKDARTMKTTHGEFVSGYNMQIGVDAEKGIVLGAFVSNRSEDSRLLGPLLAATKTHSGISPKRVVADKGYESPDNLKAAHLIGSKTYIFPKDPKPKPFKPDEMGVFRCLAGHAATKSFTTKDELNYTTYKVSQCRLCALREACGKTSKGHQREMNVQDEQQMNLSKHNGRRCRSEPGKKQLKIRGQTIELTHARMKRDLRMRRLHLKGLDGARVELLFACLTLNLQKILELFAAALAGFWSILDASFCVWRMKLRHSRLFFANPAANSN